MVCTYTEKAGGTGDAYTVHAPKTCCFALVVAQKYNQNFFKLHLFTVIFWRYTLLTAWTAKHISAAETMSLRYTYNTLEDKPGPESMVGKVQHGWVPGVLY